MSKLTMKEKVQGTAMWFFIFVVVAAWVSDEDEAPKAETKPKSDMTVEQFQVKQGLKVDGLVGNETCGQVDYDDHYKVEEACDARLTLEMECKATIAVVMGRDPRIINTVVSEESRGSFLMSYIRPDDGTKWDYKCMSDGKNVTWGMAGQDTRWRFEDEYNVTIDGNTVRVGPTYDNTAGGLNRNFKLGDLK